MIKSSQLLLLLFFSVFGLAGAAHAQQRTLSVQPASSGQRLALVIGNDAYQKIPALRNARADARAMAQALQQTGFEVILRLDQTERQLRESVRNFKARLNGGSEAVFYFAGHGVQLGSANYLLPVDVAGDNEDQVKDDAMPLQRVLDDLADQKVRFSLAIVDACRNNPFRTAGRAIGGRGLAPTNPATGQMVLYSAGAGQTALDRLTDSDRDPNGLFTRVLLKEMQRPGVSVDRVLRNVRDEVVRMAKSVGHEQVPALYDQAIGEFYFRAGTAVASAAAATAAIPTDPGANDRVFWESVKDSKNVDELKAYLEQFANGQFVALARTRLRALEQSAPRPPAAQVASAAPSTATTQQAAPAGSLASMARGTVFRDCADCPEMVVIPPGSFTMGSPASEPLRESDEGPQHTVTIARPFAAGKFEVTFDEWDACVREGGCSHRPGDQGWGRGKRPVINVSWQDAKAYTEWLSRKSRKTYRLLSEAQWEYVARAGTTTAFSFGASITPQQANYNTSVSYVGSPVAITPRGTVPVGGYPANAFGLHDVHGNVWEWTEDCWNGSYAGAPTDGSAWASGDCSQRVLRGGSWISNPQLLLSANRYLASASLRLSDIGFRVSRTD